ncbi:excinuclease ABC subunit UvrC [Ruminococcaceae bacterium OttesenSCG-928-D13]|nr:excinuclease ABC subunit UvrC [Ruminococcaceae bacterium OttesenSCG-928-D13]
MTTAELYQKAKALPLLPGVYIIRNGAGEIIYIGKAKRLRTRVSQYFRAGVPHDEKVTRMIAAAREFDVIVTGSEFEALVLECDQIKRHKPHYNILLKDDKGYRYIRVSEGDWPRISAEKQRWDDKTTWLGPYMSAFAVNQSVQAAMDAFRLPRCSRRFPQDFGKQRPCLYAHIGKCMAVCTGKISKENYNAAVGSAVRLISRGESGMLDEMRAEMDAAAENLDFERAAMLRDQISAIEKLNEGQNILQNEEQDQDIIAFAAGAGSACAAILRYRGGRLCDKREFIFHDEGALDAVREEFLPSYYLGEDEDIPKVIAVDAPLPDQPLLARLLGEKRGSKVRIYTPERGDMRKLVETAYVNAVERLARESGRTRKEDKALDELAGLLGLQSPPAVIESYDISNWGDGTSVCGMVVFENGRPKKAGYRRFKIKTVTGTDDYASMAEALLRRAAEYDGGAKGQFGTKPDLILLDGGLGQVHAGAAVLAETGLADVPLFGMVKDNRHRTRGIIAPDGGEIALSMHRGPFTFVTGIQDEVHRFAIGYQRQNAKKKTFSSTLTTLPGIGPATAKALMGHFKTLRAISAASEAELAAVKGVSKAAARVVYTHYHPDETTGETTPVSS